MTQKRRISTTSLLALAGIGLCFGPIAKADEPALISKDKVRLGVLTDMTSLYAVGTGSGSVLAAQMAVDDFGGKVLGKPIEVLSADHQNKPDIGSSIARQWVDQDKVVAVIDVPTSSIALAVQKITRDTDRAFLISGGGSSELTGTACSPNAVQWTYDTYGQTKVMADALVKRGGKKWYFVTADYTFGQVMERDGSESVRQAGGTVVGKVRHPLHSADFSSFLLQAQGSGANVVAFANAGGDTTTAIKQAVEFGLPAGGQQMAALLTDVADIMGLGQKTAQNLFMADAWYWDLNDETRAFGRRFFAKQKTMPSAIQAGVYSVTLNYLKAMQAVGTDSGKAVIAQMKTQPVNDMFTKGGVVRADGRMVHDMYLMQVKPPEESKEPWDLLRLIDTIPGNQAFRPLTEGGCPLVVGKN